MEVKLLRLFGIDLNPLEGSQDGSKNRNLPVEVPENAERKSSESHAPQKMYECGFCFKKFKNSQALGGHQNAHKKERRKKRRMQLQEKTQNQSIHHNSLTYSGYFPPFVSHFQFCQDSLISFNSLYYHNQTVNRDACFDIAGHQCTTEGEYKRPLVVVPSPSDVSKDCQNL